MTFLPFDEAYRRAKASAKTRAWYAANREYSLREQKRRYKEKPLIREGRKRSNLKRLYGITLEQYNAMFEAQDRKCAICDATEDAKWHTDHCHITNVVRGILCNHCNRMLGGARDDAKILRKAIRYLHSSRLK